MPAVAFAQTQDPYVTKPANLVCDPWPADINSVDLCIYWGFVNPTQTRPEVGEPTNPVDIGIAGTYGLNAAYNSTNNTYFVLGNEKMGDVWVIYGTILDANTNEVIVPKFRVDQTTAFAGSPKVVYNPQTNQYFVAWADARRGDQVSDNYGRIVNADGSFAGNDFLITTGAFLEDLDYDATNNVYVVTSNPNFVSFKTVDATGTVGPQVNLDPGTGHYNGQASLAVNSVTGEYWVAYVDSTTVSPPCPGRCEDNRIYMVQVDSQTFQKIGQPILVSTPKPGVLLGQPSVAFDPTTGSALVTWMDWQVGGIMGQTVYADGTLGVEKQLLTPTTDSSSDFFGGQTITYNPATGTYFMSALDNNGGTMLLELVGSVVIDSQQCIAPSSETGFNGQFWPAHADTNTGAICLSSKNYGNILVGTSQSPEYKPPVPPVVGPPYVPKDAVKPETIGQAISQIYMWALGAAAVLAVLMIILGGYYVMTSSGNAAQATKGKEYIYSSLIGLALLLASYLILSTINPDLTNFNVNIDNLNPPK